MNKQFNNKMQILKKVFLVLLILDVVGLVLAAIALLPTFQTLAGYGQFMLIIFGVIVAVIAAVMVFEILAKLFLLRSTSPAFSWSSGRKGYATVARLLVIFNLCAVIFNLLSTGGEGATLLNQGRLYLQALSSLVEVMAAFFYLRTVKKLLVHIDKK